MERIIKIGKLETGQKNTICDVEGVLVGHYTVEKDDVHTGVTAILPHNRNTFKEKVTASCFAFNGFGKSMGFIQVDELGTVETPILLTNTLAIGRISDGLIDYMLTNNPDIGFSTGTVNPIVMECNDGTINNIRKKSLTADDAIAAILDANTDFAQGGVGAGAGMICHGLKGGIGSSSRVFEIGGTKYTLGVLVNSNFGSSRGRDLIVNGKHVGKQICQEMLEEDDKGSIAVVIATDVPLDSRQLKRIIKRSAIGIGRTGSFVGHGSGDVFLGFTTRNPVYHYPEKSTRQVELLNEGEINICFRAAVEAVEEAIINSMLYADSVKGFKKEIRSLNEFIDIIK